MPSPAVPPLLLEFAGSTDVGLRRDNNEDAWWAGSLAQLAATPCTTRHGRLRLAEGVWLGVSDGLGGANAGEIASRIAIQETQSVVAAAPRGSPVPTVALQALQRANTAILRASMTNPQWQGMGATLSFFWAEGPEAVIGQVGDSRIYRLRAEWLDELSVDHSPVGRLRQSGRLSESDARRHPSRHVIDQCLGGGDAGLSPDCESTTLRAGDVLLLCSDGLTDGVPDADLAAVLESVAKGDVPPTEAVEELIVLANRTSGRDNVTVIVAHCVAEAAEPRRRAKS